MYTSHKKGMATHGKTTYGKTTHRKTTHRNTTHRKTTHRKTTRGKTIRMQLHSQKCVDMSWDFEDGIGDVRCLEKDPIYEYDSEEDDPHPDYVADWYTGIMYEQLNTAHHALVNFWLEKLTAMAGKRQRYRKTKPWTELKELLTYDTIYSKSSHWDNLLKVIEWHDFVELMPSEKSRTTLSSLSL